VTAAAHPLLPPASDAPAVWRVLDTRFDAARLLALWQAWRASCHTLRTLHVVAFTDHPPTRQAVRAAATPAQTRLADELAEACWGLLPGMHRLTLDAGHLQLTLCVGDRSTLLGEQRFEADALWLDPDPPWPPHALKAVARCSRRGCTVAGLAHVDRAWASALREAGFTWRDGGWRFDPPWSLRRAERQAPCVAPGRCAVVGAGLAGASVAAALARRGWQVDVLDAAPAPAAGASGLPAGLLIPYASANDSPRARLTRAGLRLMRMEAQRLLRAGEDWGPTGVLELRLQGRGGLPRNWPAAGAEISHAIDASRGSEPWRATLHTGDALWHAPAAWLKPAQLVRAWLAQDGVRFHGQHHVTALRPLTPGWALLDAQGQTLAEADHVVLANALDAPRLLATAGLPLPAVHGMRGVLSWGLHTPALDAICPSHPVNGAGSFIPQVPTPQGPAWYAGSTYEACDGEPAPLTAHLQADLDKLQRLLPAVAAVLAADYANHRVRSWEAVRCVSRDRLPLAGAAHGSATPTLWIDAAMGSRGLSLAMLCAELLAGQIGAEPWPVEARLAHHLHPLRHAPAPA